MKNNNPADYDINELYNTIEEMAEYICYLESILDVYAIDYVASDF